MGISTYSDERAAHGVAAKFEKLGGFVGRLWLAGDKGFNFARTSHPLHLTVWGEPIKLLESVIDIEPVK
jgi:hypothetical protein